MRQLASPRQWRPGMGSTCQARPRAQPSVRAAPASSWPPNGTGRAKINTHLAAAAALRSLLREEAVSASAGSSLPRAGGRGRPRRSLPVGDGRGTARAAPVPAMERVPPTPILLPGSASQPAKGGRQPPRWDVGLNTSPHMGYGKGDSSPK